MTRTVLRRDCLYMLEKVRRAGDRYEKKMREAKEKKMSALELIETMTREEMCELRRFAPAGHPYFVRGTPEQEAFEKRFTALGEFSPSISKEIGWSKP